MGSRHYVENNPVAAKMVAHAPDWPWSSAKSHVRGQRTRIDPLTDMAALADIAPNWRAMLHRGLAGDADAKDDAVAEAIEARLRTGRPLAAEEWVKRQEASMGRKLNPAKRGPKPQSTPKLNAKKVMAD